MPLTQDQLISHISSSILRTKKSRMSGHYFLLSSSSSVINLMLAATSYSAITPPINLARDSPATSHLLNASKTCSVYQDNHQRILLLTLSMNAPKRLGFHHHVKRS